MTFKQRLPFFLGGLTVGIVLVYFFLGKKNTTFDYGPNARLLKNIRTKDRLFSSEVQALIDSKKIDTASISNILKNGDANMWDKVKLDTCIVYEVSGTKEFENITLTVKNCKNIAFIEEIAIK